MNSIRGRLSVRLLVALTSLLVVCAVVLAVGVRAFLVAQFDSALSAQARALAMLATDIDGQIDFDFADELSPEFTRGKHAHYFELFRADGTVIERSQSLGADSLPRPSESTRAKTIWDLRLPDGRAGRAIALEFAAQIDPDDEGDELRPATDAARLQLVIAAGRESIDRPMSALLAGLLGVGALFAAGIVLIVRSSVRKGLAPLERLSSAVGALEPDALELHIATSELPAELQPIASRLRDSLARLSAAFEREHRFTSSAAHELRTPIAELRTLSEFALKWPEDDRAQGDTLTSIVAVTHRMERVVDHLLRLARAESFAPELALERVELAPLVDELWTPLASVAANKHLRCELDLPRDANAHTDRTLLASVFGNVLQNAVEHAPRGGRVALSCVARDDVLELRVANSNNTLETPDLAHIFEPLWRKDAGRSSTTHSGLGLTLAAALAKPLHITLRPELVDGEFVMHVTLPRTIAPG